MLAADNDFIAPYPLDLFGWNIKVYTGVVALVANAVVSTLLTLALRAAGSDDRLDETRPEDFDELVERPPQRRPMPEPPVQPA